MHCCNYAGQSNGERSCSCHLSQLPGHLSLKKGADPGRLGVRPFRLCTARICAQMKWYSSLKTSRHAVSISTEPIVDTCSESLVVYVDVNGQHVGT